MKEQLVSAFTTFVTSPAPAAAPSVTTDILVPTSIPPLGRLNSNSTSSEQPAEPAMLLACAIARALRLLFAQLKLLKLDTANSRLAMLSRQIQGAGAVSYLQGRFASQYQLPPAQLHPSALLAALPRTKTWLEGVSPALVGMSDFLAVNGMQLGERISIALSQAASGLVASQRSDGANSTSNVPTNLRTGLRNTSGNQGVPAAKRMAPSTGPLVAPVQLGSWRAWVRAGAVELIAGTTPAISRALPETLAWDVERLHAAQNKFQHIAVVTTGEKRVAGDFRRKLTCFSSFYGGQQMFKQAARPVP